MGLSMMVLIGEEILRPFRADREGSERIPRALPWASELRAVGAAGRGGMPRALPWASQARAIGATGSPLF